MNGALLKDGNGKRNGKKCSDWQEFLFIILYTQQKHTIQNKNK
jgi:hypothetical protein